MTELSKHELQIPEALAQIHNPARWSELFLVFAIHRCRLLWPNIGIPMDFTKNPSPIAGRAAKALQEDSNFSELFVGNKQEFVTKWTELWSGLQRDFFAHVTDHYGIDNARLLYQWCYWQGGVGFPLQPLSENRRNSTTSILHSWHSLIVELAYHYYDENICDAKACPPLPPELQDWLDAAEDLQNLNKLPPNAPEFTGSKSEDGKQLSYQSLMLSPHRIDHIRSAILRYYNSDPCQDDERIDGILQSTKIVPFNSWELDLIKYIGTDYPPDEHNTAPIRVEKYIDIDLILKYLLNHHRVYSVVIELEKSLSEVEKNILIQWGRTSVVQPPYGNPRALLWPSEAENGKS